MAYEDDMAFDAMNEGTEGKSDNIFSKVKEGFGKAKDWLSQEGGGYSSEASRPHYEEWKGSGLSAMDERYSGKYDPSRLDKKAFGYNERRGRGEGRHYKGDPDLLSTFMTQDLLKMAGKYDKDRISHRESGYKLEADRAKPWSPGKNIGLLMQERKRKKAGETLASESKFFETRQGDIDKLIAKGR